MKITCKICKKKYIDYLEFICKCNLKMCNNCVKKHNLECEFDYHTEHKEKLKKCLVKIQKNTIEKI